MKKLWKRWKTRKLIVINPKGYAVIHGRKPDIESPYPFKLARRRSVNHPKEWYRDYRGL